jgi:ABC-type glycerol-3-phosphate transport system substrate-binding protein
MASVLAACAPKIVKETVVVEREKIVKETVEVEKVVKEAVEVEKEVTRVVEKVKEVAQAAPEGIKIVRLLSLSWVARMTPVPVVVQAFNADHDDIQIKVDETPEGWQTKVLSMIRDDELLWSGFERRVANTYVREHALSGMIQPMTPFIESSSTPAAKTWPADMWPSIYDGGKYEGKFYILSDGIAINLPYFYKDILEKAGYEKPPESFDEWTEMLSRIKATSAEDNVVPFLLDKRFHFGLLQFFYNMSDESEWFDANGAPNITSDKFMDTVKFLKSWFDEGLMTPDSWETGDDYWRTKKGAIYVSSAKQINWARNIYGGDSVWAGQLPTRPGKTPVGNPNVEGPMVFAKAPDPQPLVDMWLEKTAPGGKYADVFWPNMISNFGYLPPSDELYTKYVETVPANTWLEDAKNQYYPVVPNNGLTEAVNLLLMPKLTRVWTGEATVEETIDEVKKDLDAQIAEMQG